MKKDDRIIFKKHNAARVFNFLFLIPFILAYRPLLVYFKLSEFLLYSAGIIVIIVIIIVSNRLPYVTIDGDRLILHLHYYQRPEVHFLEKVTLIEILTSHSLRVHSRDFRPVRLHLNPKDLKKLVNQLNKRNLKIKEL